MTSTPDPEARRRYRAGIACLAIGETLVWAGLFYSFAALFLAWETDLGWAKTDLALGVTLAIVTSAAAAPLAGRIIDAGHGRLLMSLGAVFGALALAALLLITTREGFLMLWVLVGAAQAATLYEPCFSFVTRALGRDARYAITRITLVAGFASTLSFPAAAYLSEAFGWRVCVLVFAGVVALLAAPLLYAGTGMLEAAGQGGKPAPTNKAAHKSAVQQAVRRPEFWLIALAFALVALDHGMILNHILPIFTDRGASLWAATAAASLVGPAQVAGRVAMMRFETRLSSFALAATAVATATVAAIVLWLAGHAPILIFPFAVLQGCAFGVFSILRPVIVAETLGRTAFGAISARSSIPYLVAVALSPYLAALLWGIAGYDLVIGVAGLFALVAFFTLRYLTKRGQPIR